MDLDVHIKVVNEIKWIGGRRKVADGWMTNDSVQKETYLKQKKKKLQRKLYTPWERGGCRKCEEISQDQSIRIGSIPRRHSGQEQYKKKRRIRSSFFEIK